MSIAKLAEPERFKQIIQKPLNTCLIEKLVSIWIEYCE
jgi:hypothetical protein